MKTSMKTNIELNITPDEMGLTVEEAAVLHTNIENGYVHIINTEIEYKLLQDCIQKLKDRFNPEIYDYSKNISVTIQMYSDEAILYFKGNTKNVSISFFCKDPKTAKEIWDLVDTDSEESNIQISVDTMALVQGRFNHTNKFLERSDIDYVSDLYYPYNKITKLFNEYFQSPESILLLTGDPGLGKSKLATLAMQFAIDNPEILPYPLSSENPYINLVFVRGIEILSSEEFWMELEEFTPDFVIIDDLDNMLTTREAEVQSQEDIIKNKFMNQFLSFTDGIEKRSTKFIITTNQNYKDIDSAILREGRLFDILEMRALNANEALEIWNQEGLEEIHFSLTDSEITAAKLSTEIFKHKHKFSNKDYLLEDGISKVQEAKDRRKIKI